MRPAAARTPHARSLSASAPSPSRPAETSVCSLNVSAYACPRACVLANILFAKTGSGRVFGVKCRQQTFFTHPSSNLARGKVVRAVKQNDKKEEVCLFGFRGTFPVRVLSRACLGKTILFTSCIIWSRKRPAGKQKGPGFFLCMCAPERRRRLAPSGEPRVRGSEREPLLDKHAPLFSAFPVFVPSLSW